MDKQRISLTLSADVLERLNSSAAELSINRSAYVTICLQEHWRQADLLRNFGNTAEIMRELRRMQEYVVSGVIPEE